MVLGINTIRDTLLRKPKLEGPSILPDYFPVQPKGCEKHADKLFTCLSNEATSKARDMEQAGLHKSYFSDVIPKPVSEDAAKLVRERAAESYNNNKISSSSVLKDDELPRAGENPLDQCRDLIAYYKRCCDRELKKKHNWILTEPYRVQEEYRYNANSSSSSK